MQTEPFEINSNLATKFLVYFDILPTACQEIKYFKIETFLLIPVTADAVIHITKSNMPSNDKEQDWQDQV